MSASCGRALRSNGTIGSYQKKKGDKGVLMKGRTHLESRRQVVVDKNVRAVMKHIPLKVPFPGACILLPVDCHGHFGFV